MSQNKAYQDQQAKKNMIVMSIKNISTSLSNNQQSSVHSSLAVQIKYCTFAI